MSFKWVIDSSGNAVNIPQNQNAMRILKQEVRLNELHKFTEEFSKTMEEFSEENGAYFDFMLQPLYNKECVIYFAKSNIPTTAKALKLSRELAQNPHIEKERPEFQDKDVLQFCKSIYQDETKEKKPWFYLSIGCVVFERNFYDCKYIDITHIAPVPYEKFAKNLQPYIIIDNKINTDMPSDKFGYISNGISLMDKQKLLHTAYVTDLADEENSPFLKAVSDFLDKYKQENGIDKRDNTSNKATFFISLINNFKGDIFPTYLEIKSIIKNIYNQAHINYTKYSNLITVQIDDRHKIKIFVCNGNNGIYNYIINGNVFTSIDELKVILQYPDLIKPNDWFKNKVLPHIKVCNRNTKTVEKG